MAFFEELKRRNVVRVGIAYVIVAWLLLQVADLVLENIDAPGWIMQVFMLALAIGLPLALLFAWAFELTPEGLKREHEVDRTESITHVTGRRLDRAIIVILVLALGYFAWDKWLSGADPGAPVTAGPVTAEAPAGAGEANTNDRSIAVLPFANRSAREEDAFFSEGIHDDLLTSLAKVGSLKVISRTSVMRYQDTTLSIPEIAKELGVTKILEGGIQRSGNQVRINVQLIDAVTDEHLWAENYDRELSAETLFGIQSEISREIVKSLRATLSDDESERLAAVPTTSLEAYGEFVLGRKELARRTNESLAAARAHFEKAIELDPEYALAYVGLADALFLLGNYGDMFMAETFEPRQAAIDRALAIDPDLGEAYTSLGQLREDQELEPEAEQHFKRAIELAPGYATAYHWYAAALNDQDRPEEQLVLARRALDLDPLAPVMTTIYAAALRSLGRTEQALAAEREGLRRNPGFPLHYNNLAAYSTELGRIGEAMVWMDRLSRLSEGQAFGEVRRCMGFLDLGDDRGAETCLEAAEEAYPQASLGWRMPLHHYRREYAEAARIALQWNPTIDNEFSRHITAWNLANIQDWTQARAIVERDHPEFWGDAPVKLQPQDVWAAAQAALILQQTGEQERADYLFDQVLAMLATQDRTRGLAYGNWDVFVHAARGHHEKAIAALRAAIDSGWRDDWWRLRHPMYDPLLNEPRWVALMTELEADIARQRQWYENHKDDPIL